MKLVALALICATTVTAAGSQDLYIPEAYLYKCDALEVESERIDCLGQDLLRLNEIRESIQTLKRENTL